MHHACDGEVRCRLLILRHAEGAVERWRIGEPRQGEALRIPEMDMRVDDWQLKHADRLLVASPHPATARRESAFAPRPLFPPIVPACSCRRSSRRWGNRAARTARPPPRAARDGGGTTPRGAGPAANPPPPP